MGLMINVTLLFLEYGPIVHLTVVVSIRHVLQDRSSFLLNCNVLHIFGFA